MKMRTKRIFVTVNGVNSNHFLGTGEDKNGNN